MTINIERRIEFRGETKSRDRSKFTNHLGPINALFHFYRLIISWEYEKGIFEDMYINYQMILHLKGFTHSKKYSNIPLERQKEKKIENQMFLFTYERSMTAF